jgi:hypothetical protein
VPELSGRLIEMGGRLTPTPVVLPVAHLLLRRFIRRAEAPAAKP